MSSLPLSVRVSLLYNRLFRFRASRDWLIKEKREAAARRNQDSRGEDLRYAEMEFNKAPQFLKRFGDISVAGKRVLDFGCRFGGSSVFYASQGAAHVVGVDVDPNMLDVASEYRNTKMLSLSSQNQEALPSSKVDFRLANARTIPAKDESVDMIFSEDVVEHLESPEDTLAEWWRVLAPAGRVYVSFGPLWYHPHGIHQWEIFHAPWMHVLFSPRTCLQAKFALQGIKEPLPSENDTSRLVQRYFELNRMSLTRFQRLIHTSRFKYRMIRIHAVRNLKLLLFVPILKELFASQVDCILEKQ